MKRVKIGDIVRIETSKGDAYAQYTHKHPKYGALLRILPGFYEHPDIDYASLIEKQERFWVFFPLQAAVNQTIVSIVKNSNVPIQAQEFPLFRTGVKNPSTGKVDVWWLWDGEQEWKVGKLTPEQRKLSIRGIWNDTLLIERIENAWKPEDDPR